MMCLICVAQLDGVTDKIKKAKGLFRYELQRLELHQLSHKEFINLVGLVALSSQKI